VKEEIKSESVRKERRKKGTRIEWGVILAF